MSNHLIITLIAFWFCFIGCINGGHKSSNTGAVCAPPLGYLPLSCRTLSLVSTSSRPLPVHNNGVNVCEVTRTYLVQVYEYRYRQQCGWSYNRHYRYYYWSCRTSCVPGWRCSDTTRLDTSTQNQCCEGFLPRSVPKYNHPPNFHLYYIPENTQPSGCPLAKGNTLLECLEVHGLTAFINLIRQSGLIHLVNTTNAMITVFAPSNDALNRTALTSEEEIVRFVQSHIVDKPIDSDQLYHSSRLATLSDVTLYVTLVDHYFYRGPSQSKVYWNQQDSYVLLRTDRFVSGNLITEADACVIRNGDLHLIDSVIPVANSSLVDIISTNPSLAMFNMALDALNLKPFLSATDTPNTIFAPSNVAFADFPEELINCLSNFDREPFNDLILFHISKEVNYLSSLSQQRWLYTRLLKHMQVAVDDNGAVVLGEDRVPISIPNIPASDGVIHIVDDLIFPTVFDYGDCLPFVGSGMLMEDV